MCFPGKSSPEHSEQSPRSSKENFISYNSLPSASTYILSASSSVMYHEIGGGAADIDFLFRVEHSAVICSQHFD